MEGIFGYNGRILHIDLTRQETRVEIPGEKAYRIYAGGGLLGTWLLLRDTEPGNDALSPENPLIFASSVIAGQEAPGLARFSVVTKSPLSGGIAETRCEGSFGRYLKGSGYDAVVIHGRSEMPVALVIENGNATFLDAADLWGCDTTVATDRLLELYGAEETRVAVIGPAGENLVRFASIVTDYAIQAMRMGVGAVMGSKNVKALVLKGCNLPAVFDSDGMAAISNRFMEDMPKNTLAMWQKNAPGFSASADLSDSETAYIGVDNYRSNLKVEGSNYTRANYLKYHRGAMECPGCPNDCIKRIDPAVKTRKASGIHQEVTGSMGPNIGNKNLEIMLESNVLCNLLGLDPVSLGFTISFAMECFEAGLLGKDDVNGYHLQFGAEEDILALVRDIANRKGVGDLLAEGSLRAGKKIGNGAERYAMQVKGIEMVSFEPRTQTNLALGYATAPTGPRYDICEHDWDFDTVTGWDHTLEYSRAIGVMERIPMQYAGKDKVSSYKALSNLWSACDAMDLCIFASAPTRLLDMETISRLVQAITGWKTSSYEFMRWGERRNHLMRVYNLREGIGKAQDTLPERFFNEPIAYGRLSGVVLSREDFQEEIDTYYSMMGWDAGGVPLESTLLDHRLDWLAPMCAKWGMKDKQGNPMNMGNTIDAYRDDIRKSLCEIIRFQSVREPALPGKPYGTGAYEALRYALDLGASWGFVTKDVDGFAGHVEYGIDDGSISDNGTCQASAADNGSGNEYVAILAHLDVVPAGLGWTYPPYGGVMDGDRIYGRGASDNKGPAIAALYGLKALRDAGYRPKHRIRVILGCAEETGSEDMDYYFGKEPLPLMAFTPDVGYPAINREKGILRIRIMKDNPGLDAGAGFLCRIQGGDAINMVPRQCSAIIDATGLSEGQRRFLDESAGTQGRVSAARSEEDPTRIVLETLGKSSHGAAPEMGINAVLLMTKWIGELGEYGTEDRIDAEVANGDTEPANGSSEGANDSPDGKIRIFSEQEAKRSFLSFVNGALGAGTDGRGLGIQCQDAESGALSMNVGSLLMDSGSLTIAIDIRYPITMSGAHIIDLIRERAETTDASVTVDREVAPLHFPEDHPLIGRLSAAYEMHTGKKLELLSTGGGTYARSMAGRGIGFGGAGAGAHSPDEFVDMEDLMQHARICTQAMVEISR